MKRKILLTVITIMTLGCSMTVYAQPKTMSDGTEFDAEFYANRYSDVKAVFGDDEEALYHHYVQHGKSEGRLPHNNCGVDGCIVSEQHTHGHSSEYHDTNEYHESNDHNNSNKHDDSNKHGGSGHGGKHH